MNTANKKNIIWNIIGATACAFNSLFFTIVVTRINGINDAGIFAYCFATACLLYYIANYCGRAFQVTDIAEKNTDTDYIYNRTITCIVMLIISIIFSIIKGYDNYKISIFILLCIYKCLEAFSEVLYGVLQKNEKLYQVGISLFVKAILGIICFTIIEYITKNLILACIVLILSNIALIILYDIKNLKKVKIIKTEFSKQANNRIFKTGFFTFILTFLGSYLINAPRYAIDDLSTNDLQTIFGIIIMPATFMGIVGQYIIQPALTKITQQIKNKEYKDLKNNIIKIIFYIAILGVLVFIVACFLELPVLELVYTVKLEQYFISMIIIIFGSIFYSMSIVLSTILIAMRKTLAQVIGYAIVAILTTLISYYMVNKYQIFGASITYMLTMIIITIIFGGITFIKMKEYKKIWRKG